jgi:hypothetical protein
MRIRIDMKVVDFRAIKILKLRIQFIQKEREGKAKRKKNTEESLYIMVNRIFQIIID